MTPHTLATQTPPSASSPLVTSRAVNTHAPAIPVTASVWVLPSRGEVGMTALIAAESAIFTIFVIAYLFYAGKSLTGPTPRDVLDPPIFYTACLLASSVTLHVAVRALRRAAVSTFAVWWLATIVLGAAFMYGTTREWQRLIYTDGLTIATNLFGTTYYSLVGLHAFHVTVGLLLLTLVWLFWTRGYVTPHHSERLDVLSLYWHFVDAVWVVVFLVVYVVAR